MKTASFFSINYYKPQGHTVILECMMASVPRVPFSGFATEALVIDVCSLAIVLPDNVKHTVDKMTEESPSKAGTKPCYVIVVV